MRIILRDGRVYTTYGSSISFLTDRVTIVKVHHSEIVQIERA